MLNRYSLLINSYNIKGELTMWFEEKQLFVVFGLCGMVLTNRCEMMINNWSLSRWRYNALF